MGFHYTPHGPVIGHRLPQEGSVTFREMVEAVGRGAQLRAAVLTAGAAILPVLQGDLGTPHSVPF